MDARVCLLRTYVVEVYVLVCGCISSFSKGPRSLVNCDLTELLRGQTYHAILSVAFVWAGVLTLSL